MPGCVLVSSKASVRSATRASSKALACANVRRRSVARNSNAPSSTSQITQRVRAVLRLRAERANLRRINWGIAQDLSSEAIIGGMVVAR